MIPQTALDSTQHRGSLLVSIYGGSCFCRVVPVSAARSCNEQMIDYKMVVVFLSKNMQSFRIPKKYLTDTTVHLGDERMVLAQPQERFVDSKGLLSIICIPFDPTPATNNRSQMDCSLDTLIAVA